MNEGNNFNNGYQDPLTTQNGYQDPLNAQNGQPAKKKVGGSTIAATIVSVVVFILFGLIGGLICFGGYAAVNAIAKSKMPLAARIILSIIVGIFFLVLLIAFILFSGFVQANV